MMLDFFQAYQIVRTLARHPSPLDNRIRALRRLAWRQFRKRVLPWPLLFNWNGLQFEVFPDSTSAGRVYYLDTPDWWEMNFLKHFLQSGDIVADIGSNVGAYTLLVASLVGPSGEVASFEPDPQNAQRLRQQVRRNALGQVEVLEVAVGERDGRLGLVAGHDVLSNVANQTTASINVRAIALDTFYRNRKPPIYIKVDVEGYEQAVLQGAITLMSQGFPLVWQLELGSMPNAYGYSSKAITALLHSFGYDFYRYCCDRQYLVPTNDFPSTLEDNILAIRELEQVNSRLRMARRADRPAEAFYASRVRGC